MDTTKNTIDLFDDFARQYQDKYMEQDLYADSLNQFCRLVKKPAATILDLACGPGNITHYLLRQRPDFRILGTDLSPKMLELAGKNNPGAAFQSLDTRDITRLDQKFDGVICGFGLPYLSREEAIKLIRDTRSVLHPGGIFYLSTMEDDYRKSGFKGSSSGGERQLYIYYHQADYLCEALEASGFDLLEIIRQDFPQADGSTSKDLLMLAGAPQ